MYREKEAFTVTQQHIDLLQEANVGWEYCEFGAPSIDCNRPYGNGDVYNDIALILGISSPDNEEGDFTPQQYALMERLHKETQIALQIFLHTGKMEIGTYEAPLYTREWVKEK